MLEVQNLQVFYGDVQALWDVSFAVRPGEIVTLVGSNGAGKTTTLKTISGLLRPAAGHVRLEGQDLGALPPHQILSRGIAQIPEGRRLWPHMTVLENLELGAYTAAARHRKDETLEWAFGLFPRLRERRGQLSGTLSGGEQQMVAIARGLMSRPRLLMLDEPSLGLAPLLVEEVFRIVREINGQGVTVLLVEQNLRQALEVAHRAYVLETGRVTLSGPSPEVLANAHIRAAYLGL
ncbi:MAG TPA: ABC transporter ATP-binding protein [Candidatus Sulfotelmatobacter sp.]|nr:ABC transporter ATP-binding protein [Candidatus Sulfotelmatobacter sp.]